MLFFWRFPSGSTGLFLGPLAHGIPSETLAHRQPLHCPPPPRSNGSVFPAVFCRKQKRWDHWDHSPYDVWFSLAHGYRMWEEEWKTFQVTSLLPLGLMSERKKLFFFFFFFRVLWIRESSSKNVVTAPEAKPTDHQPQNRQHAWARFRLRKGVLPVPTIFNKMYIKLYKCI